MATRAEFATYCCELLSSLGPIAARRMFGGHGFSVDGLTVAIAANLGDGDRLYLKASPDSRPQFLRAGCAQFVYQTKGEPKSLNYFTPPEEAMESPALMQPWARLAWAAAVQAQAAKPKTPRIRTKRPTKVRKA